MLMKLTFSPSSSHLHMKTCIEIFKHKGLLCWTKKKMLWRAYLIRSDEENGTLWAKKKVIFQYYKWEVGFFYLIWITPSVWQNHSIHTGKSENFITNCTIGYSSSLRWLNMMNKGPHRNLENIVTARQIQV